MTQVFVLPYSVKGNPYMELLYAEVCRDATYVAEPFSFATIFRALARRQPIVIHIHWESNVYGSRFIARSLLRIAYRFPLLFLARILGAKIVWTLHNLFSHDYPHPRIDELGRTIMWRLAQGVIIQNREIATQRAAVHPKTNVVYIPIPTYKLYGPRRPEARERMRRSLGIEPQEILLLSLGYVRAYKQPEVLIDAMRGLTGVRLVIVGKGTPDYMEQLRTHAQGAPVVIKDSFVPDAEVPDLLAAADYSIFAYNDSTMTSGVVMLSLAYGVPAILYRMSLSARELLRDGNGFAVETEEYLVRLIRSLPALPKLVPEKVEASVADRTWERAGQEVRDLYRSL